MDRTRDQRLVEAIALRQRGDLEPARQLLLQLRSEFPADAHIAMHTAWVHDSMGFEAEAVPHYRAALDSGALSVDEQRDSWLGLGSTYRALGRDAESEQTFREAMARFPDDRALRAFHALTADSLGRSREAVRELLHLLLESTSDERILSYERALAFYADDLERSWLQTPPAGG